MADYTTTRDRVETYFDRTATRTWERLTSDAPVSRIRQTVREGRDRMRALMLGQLPKDLRGARILDAGCGTGMMTEELAQRGRRSPPPTSRRNWSGSRVTAYPRPCARTSPSTPAT
jgi:magnesium-protoporphyrin O-methyltransferase